MKNSSVDCVRGKVVEELNKGYEFTKAQIAELEPLFAAPVVSPRTPTQRIGIK